MKLPLMAFVVVASELQDASEEALCDVTLNNWDGLRNTAFLRSLGNASPSFRVLGRLVKHWARRRGVVDRQKGRLSTYGLMIMLAGCLQSQGAMLSPEAVEALCERLHAAGKDVQALQQISEDEASDIGASGGGLSGVEDAKLLLTFFERYSGHRAEGHTVDLRTGLLRHEVRCPLTGVDVEAQLNRRAWRKLVTPEFSRAVTLLDSSRTKLTTDGASQPHDVVCSALEAICLRLPAAPAVAAESPPRGAVLRRPHAEDGRSVHQADPKKGSFGPDAPPRKRKPSVTTSALPAVQLPAPPELPPPRELPLRPPEISWRSSVRDGGLHSTSSERAVAVA
ncbi:unnamed protein product [Polarella glacialis]|uniref:Polynucleotide adenylyltransferase n=1 Tax=Polarella glacialis TaxID=89957 RepID=A0A813FB26_POLGL|nr:unnamed protein product [Polarella glacialis]